MTQLFLWNALVFRGQINFFANHHFLFYTILTTTTVQNHVQEWNLFTSWVPIDILMLQCYLTEVHINEKWFQYSSSPSDIGLSAKHIN